MRYLRAYWRKRAGTIVLVTGLMVFFNLYYWLLTKEIPIKYQNYFNLLLVAVLLMLFFIDFTKFKCSDQQYGGEFYCACGVRPL